MPEDASRGRDVDVAALARWITLTSGARVVGVERLTGGFSNENLLVALDRPPERLVARIVRRGSTHAACSEIARTEAAVLELAASVAPVPAVLGTDPDGEHVGRPTLLLQHRPGVMAETAYDNSDSRARLQLGAAVGAAFGALSAVQLPTAGFLHAAPAGTVTVDGWAGDDTDALVAYATRLEDGPARDLLGAAVADSWRTALIDGAPLLAGLAAAARLVHADANPKNVLVTHQAGRWHVTAVLDWEFALSGSPLWDVANLCRLHRDPRWLDGVAEGFVAGGGTLEGRWRQQAALLDAIAMIDLLERQSGAGQPITTQVAARVRQQIETGWITI